MRNSKEDKGMSTNGRKTRKEDGIRRKRQINIEAERGTVGNRKERSTITMLHPGIDPLYICKGECLHAVRQT